MKPTQREIIELAREAGFGSNGLGAAVVRHSSGAFVDVLDELETFATLLLERFSAGGEPVATVQRLAGRVPSIAWSQKRIETIAHGTKLYTRPSPTDLSAEYLRGLEDAWKVCDERANGVNDAQECADAIEALKGKQ